MDDKIKEEKEQMTTKTKQTGIQQKLRQKQKQKPSSSGQVVRRRTIQRRKRETAMCKRPAAGYKHLNASLKCKTLSAPACLEIKPQSSFPGHSSFTFQFFSDCALLTMSQMIPFFVLKEPNFSKHLMSKKISFSPTGKRRKKIFPSPSFLHG